MNTCRPGAAAAAADASDRDSIVQVNNEIDEAVAQYRDTQRGLCCPVFTGIVKRKFTLR